VTAIFISHRSSDNAQAAALQRRRMSAGSNGDRAPFARSGGAFGLARGDFARRLAFESGDHYALLQTARGP
jgi:hypothetical protein